MMKEVFQTEPPKSRWTFLSNHAHVLLCIVQDADARVRDIAARVGITERAVQRILGELDDAQVITRERQGRRTHYTVHADVPLRHALERHSTVGNLMAAVGASTETG